MIYNYIQPATAAGANAPLGSTLPPPSAPTHPFSDEGDERIATLKQFLHAAPRMMQNSKQGEMRRFQIPDATTSEYITCVYWNGAHVISGTDIVRAIQYRFRCKGMPVPRPKKLEEGIFSDLRNLKSGHDAILEEPRSDLLKYLYDNECIRTQKKQKVFLWYRVPHDNLFYDAMEREIRRLHTLDNWSLMYQQMAARGTSSNMLMFAPTLPAFQSQSFQSLQSLQPQSFQYPVQTSQAACALPHQQVQQTLAAPEPVRKTTAEMFDIDPLSGTPDMMFLGGGQIQPNNAGGIEGLVGEDELLSKFIVDGYDSDYLFSTL